MRPIARILVGVELPDEGRPATIEAGRLSRALGAELTLLHAYPRVHTTDRDAAEVASRAAWLLEDVALDLEEEGAKVARPPLAPIDVSPADALLAAAADGAFDLLVLGAERKTGLDRLLGATAERVTRESPVPVWLAHARAKGEVQRIVCAVDPSEPSKEALGAAAFLARAFVAELHTLSVLPPFGPDGAPSGPEQERPFREALGRIDLHGLEHRVLLRQGEPAPTIVEVTAQLGADLLVLGTAGRAGVARLVRGNTAERVLRDASCSVLVVPGPAKASHWRDRAALDRAGV